MDELIQAQDEKSSHAGYPDQVPDDLHAPALCEPKTGHLMKQA